jgi:nucleotide-binding universal stress UspA family protein
MRALYATDGSVPSRRAEDLIKALLDPKACEIETFSVAAQIPYITPLYGGDYELSRLDVPPINAAAVAGVAADHLATAGFNASSNAVHGDPAHEILRRADEGRKDLIVLGASHSSWLGNVLLGSVSTHVLHHATCPVIVTHRSPTGTGRILIGVDGSEGSASALASVKSFVDASKCSLTIATVVSEPWVSAAVYPPGLPFGDHAEYQKFQERRVENGWKLVERISSDLLDDGFKSEGTVLMGSAGPQLLKEARHIGAELVVVGARGFGPIRRAVMGSTSDQIMRHAPAAFIDRNPGHDDRSETPKED